MIDKRFNYVVDNGKDTIYDLSSDSCILETFIDIEETMNNLYEENKQLKQKIKSITEILKEDIGYIESLRKIEEVLK